MATFSNRRLSRDDLLLSLGAIAFPVHVWAIINVLIVFPAWLLRASLWELVGVVSYPLVAALLESCVLWAFFVILSFILPKNWFAVKFAALSIFLGWMLAAWAMLIQFIYLDIIRWNWVQVSLGLIIVVFSFGFAYWLVHRFRRLEHWIKNLAQRLMVLTYLYLLIDLLGLIILLVRNI